MYKIYESVVPYFLHCGFVKAHTFVILSPVVPLHSDIGVPRPSLAIGREISLRYTPVMLEIDVIENPVII